MEIDFLADEVEVEQDGKWKGVPGSCSFASMSFGRLHESVLCQTAVRNGESEQRGDNSFGNLSVWRLETTHVAAH